MTARPALLAALLVLHAGPAAATANLDCGIDDRAVRFELSGLMGRSGSGAILSFRSELRLVGRGTPRGPTRVVFSQDDVVQRWIVGGRIDIALRRAWSRNGRKGTVTVILRTAVDEEELEAPGTYELIVTQEAPRGGGPPSRTIRGKAGCSLG